MKTVRFGRINKTHVIFLHNMYYLINNVVIYILKLWLEVANSRFCETAVLYFSGTFAYSVNVMGGELFWSKVSRKAQKVCSRSHFLVADWFTSDDALRGLIIDDTQLLT